MEANHIHKIQYPKWLANVVIVMKSMMEGRQNKYEGKGRSFKYDGSHLRGLQHGQWLGPFTFL